ncbi:ester cyclase [Micromonospora sp. NPDC047467]|uniref:ester cyclase n=1 Tax=Micromonospora sp. NPDC047467 TaxID=3154814 RepID=UPI0033E1D07C
MSTNATGSGMTTQELRDFYLRYVELANKREFDSMADFAHEEVIMNGTPVKMADMVAEFYKHVDAVPDLHWEIQELIVEGDRVAARLIDTGTPVQEWNGLAPTGKSVRFAETAFYQVQDGKFKHMWYLMDADTVRRQLAA